jgi:hypothetical protein
VLKQAEVRFCAGCHGNSSFAACKDPKLSFKWDECLLFKSTAASGLCTVHQQHELMVCTESAESTLVLADSPVPCCCHHHLTSTQAFVDSITQAVEGFLDEHAAAFTAQLWLFLQSGLSIAAHDALLFGAEGPADGHVSSEDEEGRVPCVDEAAGDRC